MSDLMRRRRLKPTLQTKVRATTTNLKLKVID